MKSTIFEISLLSALPFAAAHGFLRQITIDGTVYKGNVPNGNSGDSVIRLIDLVDPVKGATNRAVNCGQNAKIATLVADANPNSTVTFDWAGGDGGNWPHNTGPLMTYLATCGNTTCDQFDAINAEWFKIDEAGQKNDGTWFQQDLMNGGTHSVTLPANLAAGEYLVRHEIIALHLATAKGGAEFYPSCSQIRVGGSGTGTPKASDLVSLPGAYSDDDPGIFDPAVFDSGATYVFPGPAIATLVDGGGSNRGAVGATDSATVSSTASASESTSTQKHEHCGVSGTPDSASDVSVSATATATSASASDSFVSATTSAAGATVTSFTVTTTIPLDALFQTLSPSSSAPSATLTSSDGSLALRPWRVSRVMRSLYGRV